MLTEVAVQTEKLFAQPEFRMKLEDWQVANLRYLDKLEAHFGELEEDDFESQHYRLRHDLHPRQVFDRRAEFELLGSAAIFEAASSYASAETKVLECAEVSTGQFVVYGLSLCLNLNAEDISKSAIRSQVAEVEERFMGFNGFVRDHSGEILTVIHPTIASAEANRLGVGNITLGDLGKPHVNIHLPKARGDQPTHQAYAASIPARYGTSQDFTVSAHYIAKGNIQILQPSEVIADANLINRQGLVLAAGGIPRKDKVEPQGSYELIARQMIMAVREVTRLAIESSL